MAEKIYGVFEFSYQDKRNRADALAKQKVWQALRDDGIDNVGFTTYEFASDKLTAQKIAEKNREWNKPSRSTSRCVQLGLSRRAVVVHECTVEDRTGYWKLSKKDYEAACQHELYLRMKAERSK